MSKESEAAANEARTDVRDAIHFLRERVDVNILLSGLLYHASVLAQGVISAKLKTDKEVMGMFAYACKEALEPPTRPVVVHYTDGKDKGRKH